MVLNVTLTMSIQKGKPSKWISGFKKAAFDPVGLALAALLRYRPQGRSREKGPISSMVAWATGPELTLHIGKRPAADLQSRS